MDFDIDKQSEDQEQEKVVRFSRLTSANKLHIKSLITFGIAESKNETIQKIEKGQIAITLKYKSPLDEEVKSLNKVFPIENAITVVKPLKAQCEVRGPFFRLSLASKLLNILSLDVTE